MRSWRWGFLLAYVVVLPAHAGEIDAARYEGHVALRLVQEGTISVALDEDGDGATDRLFLFAPMGPVPPGWFPAGLEAVVEVDTAALRVSGRDGLDQFRFLVGPPPERVPAVFESRGLLVMHGVALAVHDRRGLRELLWDLPSETVGPLAQSDDGCGEPDLDCSSGGLGSNGCDTQCGGGGVSSPVFGVDLAARRCGVSCAAGYFSCCKCDASGPSCRCREVHAITDCASGPQAPTAPR